MGFDTTPVIFQTYTGKWVVSVQQGVHALEMDKWDTAYTFTNVYEAEVNDRIFNRTLTFKPTFDEAVAYAKHLYDTKEDIVKPPMTLERVFLKNTKDKKNYYVYRLFPINEFYDKESGTYMVIPNPPALRRQSAGVSDKLPFGFTSLYALKDIDEDDMEDLQEVQRHIFHNYGRLSPSAGGGSIDEMPH